VRFPGRVATITVPVRVGKDSPVVAISVLEVNPLDTPVNKLSVAEIVPFCDGVDVSTPVKVVGRVAVPVVPLTIAGVGTSSDVVRPGTISVNEGRPRIVSDKLEVTWIEVDPIGNPNCVPFVGGNGPRDVPVIIAGVSVGTMLEMVKGSVTVGWIDGKVEVINSETVGRKAVRFPIAFVSDVNSDITPVGIAEVRMDVADSTAGGIVTSTLAVAFRGMADVSALPNAPVTDCVRVSIFPMMEVTEFNTAVGNVGLIVRVGMGDTISEAAIVKPSTGDPFEVSSEPVVAPSGSVVVGEVVVMTANVVLTVTISTRGGNVAPSFGRTRSNVKVVEEAVSVTRSRRKTLASDNWTFPASGMSRWAAGGIPSTGPNMKSMGLVSECRK
jgi:hypothetical protein